MYEQRRWREMRYETGKPVIAETGGLAR